MIRSKSKRQCLEFLRREFAGSFGAQSPEVVYLDDLLTGTHPFERKPSKRLLELLETRKPTPQRERLRSLVLALDALGW